MGIEQITAQDVRMALCHLGHDRAPGNSPLTDLAVVAARLRDAGFAAEAGARYFELGRLLAELVERELWLRRQRAGLVRSAAEWAELVHADFASGHVELESLSAVYHLYVRSDLGLSLDAFVRLLGDRHRRTVQRRLEHGVALVAHRLRELERDAELTARRRRCLDRLPVPAEAPLGVDGLVAQLAQALGVRSGRPVALGGIGGVGKTTVARAAVMRLIEEGRVGDVLWLPAKALVRAVREESPARYGFLAAVERHYQGALQALDGGAAGPATLIVIDGLDRPSDAFQAARAMAARAATAPVLLVGRAGWAGAPAVDAHYVPPLPLDTARRLLDDCAARCGAKPVGAPIAVAGLVAATAGIPAALERAAEALRVHDAASLATAYLEGRGVAAQLLEAIWGLAWHDASPAVQRAVRAVLALKASGIATHAQSVGAHLGVSLDEAGELLAGALDHGLLESTPGPRQPLVHPLPLLARYLTIPDSAPRAA